MSDKNINFEQAFKVADQAVFKHTKKHLSDVEIVILRGAWENKTYEEMAENSEYATNYLQRTVGPKLWRMLSKALGEEVSKTNFRAGLQRKAQEHQINQESLETKTTLKLEFPEGAVALNSAFYINRIPMENECYESLRKPGSLINIKAPKQMGKTSLLNRILEESKNLGYKTVTLNFLQAEKAVFSDLDKFLKWLCAYASQKLKKSANLSEYWDEERGSIVSCTTYFEASILEEINTPLVLALDEVDRVFQYPEIADQFFPMLRSWHEEAKAMEVWEKLRLIVVYSTEYYGKLDINQSPFNVGLPVELREFNLAEVESLGRQHSLDWERQIGEDGLSRLVKMVGGHPYLIRLMFYHLVRSQKTLNELLQEAMTDAGIYGDHLRRHLDVLKEHFKLEAALKDVVTSDGPVRVETLQGYKLYSMGLIQRLGDLSIPRCELYRQYFRERLL
ncbi:MAG TPA: AAA-like domain-containing protein [Halomicronema sp.]